VIITTEEVKGILQISGSNEYDSLIGTLIPIVQDFVIKYTNNHFEVLTDSVFTEATTLSFVSGPPAKILDSQNQFIENGFTSGVHVRVLGSKLNDGIYKVASLEAGVLTLSNDESLIDESADSEISIRITMVQFPQGLKLPVAKMVGYHFDKKNFSGVQSERFGDYSVSFQTAGSYPKSILDELDQYRQIKFVSGSKSTHYNILTKTYL